MVQDYAAYTAAIERCNGEKSIRPSSYEADVAAVDQHSSLVSVCPPKSLPRLPPLPEQEAEPPLRLMCRCLRQIGTVVPSRC